MSCVRGIIALFKGKPLHKDEQRDDTDYFSSLPTEILEIIFAYLRPKSLFENVLPVCWRFYSVVKNERWWNLRIENHPLHTQLRDADRSESSPLRSLDAIWRDEEAWTNWEQQTRHVTASGNDSIAAVRLFTKAASRFCIAATNEFWSSPSAFKLWSLDDRRENDGILYESAIVHASAISGIEMHGTDQFISGSFDKCLKLWNIDNSSVRIHHGEVFPVSFPYRRYRRQETAIHRNEHVLKEVAYENGVLACLADISDLSLHDARNGLQEVNRTTYMFDGGECRWLMSIVFKGTFIHLAFTDRLMTVDVRNLSVPVQQHMFDTTLAPDHNVTINMNWSDGLLQCSNHRGYVQEYEASTLEPRSSFSMCKKEECVKFHAKKLVRSPGSFLSIAGRSIKGFSLRPRREHLGTFSHFPENQHPTAIDALKGDVVVGCNSGSLITWTTT